MHGIGGWPFFSICSISCPYTRIWRQSNAIIVYIRTCNLCVLHHINVWHPYSSLLRQQWADIVDSACSRTVFVFNFFKRQTKKSSKYHIYYIWINLAKNWKYMLLKTKWRSERDGENFIGGIGAQRGEERKMERVKCAATQEKIMLTK